MALTSAQRIELSKKVVLIPDQIKSAQKGIVSINQELVKAQDTDAANKSFLDGLTDVIDPYQDEVELYNGVVRFKVTEQAIQDSSTRNRGNFFFPADDATPTPSIPDGFWKQLNPFANNLAVGKDYQESFGSNPVFEKDYISQIQAKIAEIEVYTDVQRTTGQQCTETTDPDTMITEESVEIYTELRDIGEEIKTLAIDWQNSINSAISQINSNPDTDSTRSAQNSSMVSDSNDTVQAITDWLALDDYDISHGITDDCNAFDSLDVNVDLGPTKFRPAELNAFKIVISDRDTRVDSRVTEVVTNLGSVTQDLSDGSITSKSGLYGQRFLMLQARLNLANGSLSRVRSLESSTKVQQELISSNEDTLEGYNDFIAASKFRADSTGIFAIHVLDSSSFSVSDSVYVVADNQPELQATIQSVDGSRLVLDIDISKRYRRDNFARVYKII